MGGEGSIQGMIISLRNNKNLLRGRKKGFFRRELSYSELRSYYKESETPINSGNKKQLRLIEIRKKIILDRQKESFRTIIILSVLLFLFIYLSTVSYQFLFNNHLTIKPYKTIEKVERNADYRMKNDSYVERFEEGLLNLKQKQYFLAVGNFENALKKKPNDPEIEIKVSEALCLLCYEKSLECEKAKSYLNEMLEKYPNDKLYLNLKDNYFK